MLLYPYIAMLEYGTFLKVVIKIWIFSFQNPSNQMDMYEEISFLSRGTDTGLWRNLSNILGPLGEFLSLEFLCCISYLIISYHILIYLFPF